MFVHLIVIIEDALINDLGSIKFCSVRDLF